MIASGLRHGSLAEIRVVQEVNGSHRDKVHAPKTVALLESNMTDWELDTEAVVSLIYTLLTFILSYVIAWFVLGGKYKLRSSDRHVLAWLLWDIIIHTTLVSMQYYR